MLRQRYSPLYGVVFLFKYPTGEKSSSEPRDGEFDYDAAEHLFFAAQTIQNACGTQALLSVLLNKEDELDIGPNLREFKDFTGAFPSEVRAPSDRDELCQQLTALYSYVERLSRTRN